MRQVGAENAGTVLTLSCRCLDYDEMYRRLTTQIDRSGRGATGRYALTQLVTSCRTGGLQGNPPDHGSACRGSQEEGSLNDEDGNCPSSWIVCVRHCGCVRLGSGRARRRRRLDNARRAGRCRRRSNVDGHPTAAQPRLDPVPDSGHALGGHRHRVAGQRWRPSSTRIRRPRRCRRLPGAVAGTDGPRRQSLGATRRRDRDRQALFRRRWPRPDQRCVQLQWARHRRLGPAPAGASGAAFGRLLPRPLFDGSGFGRHAEGDRPRRPRCSCSNGEQRYPAARCQRQFRDSTPCRKQCHHSPAGR